MARTVGSDGTRTASLVRKAALNLFARHGYAAVSMRQIASEVGIQAGSLYNYFPAKQDILFDLLTSHMEELIAAWDEERTDLDGVGSAEMLERFVGFHIRFHINRSDAVFLSYMELRNLEVDNFQHVEKLRQTYEGFLREILSAGAASGEFAIDDIPVTAIAIISMLAGLNNWYRSSGRLGLADIERIYTQLVAGAVGAPRNRENDVTKKVQPNLKLAASGR